MYALSSAVSHLYNRFVVYVKNVDYRIKINYQVCYLEAALNDRYDYSQRRIRIEKGTEFVPFPLYQQGESKPVRLFVKASGRHQALYTKAETAQFTADFLVKIPVVISYEVAELTAFINNYIVQSRTFKITSI